MNARAHPFPVRYGLSAVASPKRGYSQSLFTRKEIA